MPNSDALINELEKQRKNIKTDSYSMSIGEIINLYKEGDLKLNPAFQRLYRWKDYQKTKFIESILLGIPIPEVFVAQKSDGKWDIVDGVQRISTLLQLTNNLPGYPPLILEETKYLPSLEGFTWNEFPIDIKRIIRRSKLGINIILTENSISSQYELFQRLNTGGLHLEDQEIRNCLLIMLDNDFYEVINKLKDYDNFKECLTIKEEKFKVDYHMELIIRYLIAKFNIVDYDDYHVSKDKLSYFIDKEITRIIEDGQFNYSEEEKLFKECFDLLNDSLGKDTFKKYNHETQKFEGPFSIPAFESILPGLAENIDNIKKLSVEEFKQKIINIYKEPKFDQFSARGVKAITRFKGLTEFSKEYFRR